MWNREFEAKVIVAIILGQMGVGYGPCHGFLVNSFLEDLWMKALDKELNIDSFNEVFYYNYMLNEFLFVIYNMFNGNIGTYTILSEGISSVFYQFLEEFCYE